MMQNRGGQRQKRNNTESTNLAYKTDSELTNNTKFYQISFIAFVAIYCAVLVAFSRYTFNLDDIWMWLDIFKKTPIWNGYNPSNGRFFPLASIDLNILMQISHSPYLFFGFNAIIVAIFAMINLAILNMVNPPKNSKSTLTNPLIISLFMCSVGFVVVMFGICYPERILMVSLSAFVLCTILYARQPRIPYIIIGIIALNISIYLKEPIFIATFIIGLFMIKANRSKIYPALICASSAIYAILYIALIYEKVVKTYSRYTQNTDILTIKIQGFVNYMFNDGIIVLLLTSIVIYRIYRICRKKDSLNPLYDGLLLAGFAYFVVYIILGIFESYYLLPCYIFSGASMIYFLTKLNYIKNIFIKICLICGAIGFITSSLPSGIYNMINLKAMGVQFHDTLQFSAKYIESHPHTKIYFEGIGRGREIYAEWYVGYFIEYLNKIHYISDFDILTNMPNGKDIKLDKTSPYTYKNDLSISAPKKGDLVILNNTTSIISDINNPRYELLYKTDFATIPYINIKSIIKYTNWRFVGVKSSVFGHTNIFRMPLQTYIFVVKF